MQLLSQRRDPYFGDHTELAAMQYSGSRHTCPIDTSPSGSEISSRQFVMYPMSSIKGPF